MEQVVLNREHVDHNLGALTTLPSCHACEGQKKVLDSIKQFTSHLKSYLITSY